MRYDSGGVWIAPYGEMERAGYGQGSGRVTGERIHGTMTWTNNPRRREDGVWCPDLTGVIRTEEGAELLVSIKGYSILEQMPTVRRAIVAAVWLQAQDERYRWVNYVLGVGEGEIDEESEELWLKVSVCRNEVASGPPGIDRAAGAW
jgi:hypothetical protein